MPSTIQPADRRPIFWILQCGGWALFAAGMFVAGASIWPVGYAAVVKSSLAVFGFGASLLLRMVFRALERRGVGLPVRVTAAIPLSFGAAALWMAAHNLVVASYVAGQRREPWPVWRGAPDFTNTIYFFFVLGTWSALYFGIQAYLELLTERERLARAEGLAHRARLTALRLQLNPHFLFNTLNAISTLVAESRAAEANRMLSRLADFLRSTLDRSETDEIPLSEEIASACRYLEIEEIRFGERLRVEVSVAPGTENALVPPLILQPLVENAVRHAILPRVGGGAIAIIANRSNGWLLLGVHDDGPGLPEVPKAGRGVGLSNTRERLAELYGARAELALTRSERGGLAVSIRLPFRAAHAGAA